LEAFATGGHLNEPKEPIPAKGSAPAAESGKGKKESAKKEEPQKTLEEIPGDEPPLLTTADFYEQVVDESGQKVKADVPTLIKFFAPWCGHCKKLAPTWKQLHNEYKDKANVVKVDCTDKEGSKDLCATFGVSGYPTLVLLNGTMGYSYKSGPRTLDGLKAFIDGGFADVKPEVTFEIPEKGAKATMQPKAPAKPKRDPDQAPDITFEDYGAKVFEPIKGEDGKVKNLKVRGDKPWFVMFYSPSCGHCNKFKPTWKEFY